MVSRRPDFLTIPMPPHTARALDGPRQQLQRRQRLTNVGAQPNRRRGRPLTIARDVRREGFPPGQSSFFNHDGAGGWAPPLLCERGCRPAVRDVSNPVHCTVVFCSGTKATDGGAERAPEKAAAVHSGMGEGNPSAGGRTLVVAPGSSRCSHASHL